MARPRSDISQRIVQAATERFLHDGVDGASLREIAREAGTSIGMIYYYFPTKDDLFLGVVERVYAGLLADLEVALAPDADVDDRLLRLFARLGAMSEEELSIVRLIVREVLVSSTRLERFLQRVARGHLPLILRTIADGLAEGRLRDDLPPGVLAISVVALGLLPQVVKRLIGEHGPGVALPKPKQLAEGLGSVLLEGIEKRPAGGAARKRSK